MPRRTHSKRPIPHPTPTFAPLISIVGPTGWAIVTFHAPRQVDAFPFAIATAVVYLALVHV